MNPEEAPKTKKARTKIIQMFKDQGYQVTEEEIFPCINNMGDFKLDYQADIVIRKVFILELDPEFHGSHKHRNKDYWRDKNIEREYNIKTVRMDPGDIIKLDPLDIILECDSQLKNDNKNEL